MKNIFLILFLVSLFTSCSQKGKTTSNMVISIGSIAADNLSAYSVGGAMLYGKNITTGDKFGINLIDINGPLELALTNGEWKFSGFLWAGASKLEGVSYCASLSATLSGGEVSLPLNFDNAACDQYAANMSGSLGAKQFPTLEIVGCRTLSNIIDEYYSCDPSTNDEGIPLSYKVSIKTFNEGADFPVGASIEKCFDAAASKDVFTSLALPQARLNVPFAVEIKSYYATTCDNLKGHHSKLFDGGLLIEETAGHKVYATGSNTTKLYHSVSGFDVCNTTTSDPLITFSSGDGTPNSPYGICFPEQWDIIGQAPSNMADHFELLKDINFKGRMTDTLGAVNAPDPSACVGFAGNFRPVGQDLMDSSCTPGTETNGLSPAFSGSFNGNNNKILSPFLFHEVPENVGLFRYIVGATIKNLIVEDAEIEGENKTGIIAGSAYNTTFKNIKIKKSRVFGGTKTGSLVGEFSGASATTLSEIYTTHATVEGRGDYTGGLIGIVSYSGAVTMSKLYFAGSVEAREYSGTTSEAIGGIIGKIGTGATHSIDNVVSRGVIFGRMTKAGGIIGADYSNSLALTKFRSEVAVAAHQSIYGGLYLGGIFGLDGGAGGTFNDGYFSGTIYHSCKEPTLTDCKIGEISGDGAKVAGAQVYTNTIMNLATTYGGRTASARTDSTLRSLISSDLTGGLTDWTFTSGWYPKLNWEVSAAPNYCDLPINRSSPSVQIAAGRGTAANPVGLCSADQFSNISSGTTKHYILYNNLNMIDLMDGALVGQLDSFNGVLDGDGFLIHGMQGAKTAVELGYIKTNNGLIHDLNIIGTNITRNTSSGNYSGAGFVSTNNGTIKNINMFGLTMKSTGGSGVDQYGGLVSENNGAVEDVILGSVEIILEEGGDNIGGVVGFNNSGGIVKRASADVTIGLTGPSNFSNVAGLIGQSTGSQTLDQLEWWGYFDISPTASGTIEKCGGIAGLLTGTTLKNSLSGENSMFNVGGCHKAGGLVGELDGGASISKSYSGAEVIFGYCSDFSGVPEIDCGATWVDPVSGSSASIGPVVGNVISGIVDGNTFYLSKSHSKIEIVGAGITSATINGVNSDHCDIVVSGTQSLVNIGDYLFIDEHTKYYEILDKTVAGSTTYKIDLNDSMFTLDPNWGCDSTIVTKTSTFVKPNTVTEGTLKKDFEMKDMLTFCPSSSGHVDNGSFECLSSEWNIAEEDQGTGNGSDRVMDYYVSSILGTTSDDIPIWVIEPGKRFPKLLFDN